MGRPIGTFTRNAGTTNEMAIFKAANGVRGSSFLNPDTIVINPANWVPIRAGTDASGQYYRGGPFSYGPYGSGTTTSSNYLMQPDNLWGMRVLVTSAITVGTALIGSFSQGAALFRKGGLTVEASNSHSTFFQTDLVAIRAEIREGSRRVSAKCIRSGRQLDDLKAWPYGPQMRGGSYGFLSRAPIWSRRGRRSIPLSTRNARPPPLNPAHPNQRKSRAHAELLMI